MGVNGETNGTLSVSRLLADAKADGVRIEADDGTLAIRGDAEAVGRWRRTIKPHREAILRYLSGEPEPPEADEPPEPLVPPYQPFPIDALPPAVASYVQAAATAIGCDPAFIALPLLATLARAIGNTRVIRLKRTWTEPAVIWAAIVGKSGTHKTPAMQAATHFLTQRQQQEIERFADAQQQYERDKALHDRAFADWKRAKKGDTEPPPEAPDPPVCVRYTTTDCTVEALASILAQQFDGVLVVRDELAGWLGGIAEYKGGKGSDLGHWLACWSAAPLTVDRKTGAVKMLHVPRAAVGIVGGIQPGVLRQAIGREHLQDGLCARVLLAMPDPKPVRWSEATIDEATEAAFDDLVERLFSLEPAADADGREIPYPLDLTTDAKQVWATYFNRHREELASLDDDLAAAWSKLEAYTARLALIFQLAGWAAGEAEGEAVDRDALEAAIRLSDWFGGEAKRVYGLFSEDAEDRERRELVEWIDRRGGEVTTREVQRGHRKYRTSSDAEVALNQLARSGVGDWHDVPAGQQGGRPSRVFRLSTLSTSTEPDKRRDSGGFVDVDTVDTSETQPAEEPVKPGWLDDLGGDDSLNWEGMIDD